MFQEKQQDSTMYSEKPIIVLAINFPFPKSGLRWTSLRVTKPPAVQGIEPGPFGQKSGVVASRSLMASYLMQ